MGPLSLIGRQRALDTCLGLAQDGHRVIAIDGAPGVGRASFRRALAEQAPHVRWQLGGPATARYLLRKLDPENSRRLYLAAGGYGDPTPLLPSLDGLPKVIVWAAQRSGLLDVQAQCRALPAAFRARDAVLVDGTRARWETLDAAQRQGWLTCALLGTAPVDCLTLFGVELSVVDHLVKRGLLDLERTDEQTQVTVLLPVMGAVYHLAGPICVQTHARHMAQRLLPTLRHARVTYGTATASVDLRQFLAPITRLASHVPARLKAALLLTLRPLSEAMVPQPRSAALPLAALAAARRSEQPALIADALRGAAKNASQAGEFDRAMGLLAELDNAPLHWETQLLKGHCHTRLGAFAKAERAFDRGLSACAHPSEQLQIEVQRGLLALAKGDPAAASILLRCIRSADTHHAVRTAAVARWHYGCLTLEGPDALQAVAALERSARDMTAMGEPLVRGVTAGFIARGLRHAGYPQRAKKAALAGFEWANTAKLSAAQLDCAVELLELAHLTEDQEACLDWRLVVLEHLPTAQRPASVSRARAALSRQKTAEPKVSVDGTWLTDADGKRTDLRRRKAPRRVLAALATARLNQPGRPLQVAALFEAGWPDQHIHPESQARRVYTAIWQLRDLGLGDALMRDDGGYRLTLSTQVQQSAKASKPRYAMPAQQRAHG